MLLRDLYVVTINIVHVFQSFTHKWTLHYFAIVVVQIYQFVMYNAILDGDY